jgi:hypothetical protein
MSWLWSGREEARLTSPRRSAAAYAATTSSWSPEKRRLRFRITTALEKLGEGEQAQRIAIGWLRPKLLLATPA